MSSRTLDLWIEASIREVWTQAHFAEISYLNINPKAKNDNDAVFSSIHSFLIHCANVSKMLHAMVQRRPRKTIGDIIGIQHTSIIHNRDFRKSLEHYDAEIKRWIGKYSNGANIITYSFGPKPNFDPNTILVSFYDPNTYTYTLIDEDLNLSSLYSEVTRIMGISDGWVKSMEREEIVPPFSKFIY